jgi:hypothetical protein
MTTKKATETANINVSLYDGEFQVGFDCVGVELCQFALCEMMPPDGNEECFFREYGSCRFPAAQLVALEALHNRIKREMKKYEE